MGEDQAIGRSRGELSTKIHALVDALGNPIGFFLTGGEPGAMLADKGYDTDAVRHDLQDRGAAPKAPTKSNRKLQRSASKRLYALRSRIECFIDHLNELRCIATQHDETAAGLLGFVLLGCICHRIRFVHRA